MNKKDIRKYVLDLRDGISVKEKAQYDASIKEIILGMEEYRKADVILAYVSYRSEVDTTALIQQALLDGKYVFAPKVSGNEMEFWQITAMEDLQEGYRGIREPVQSIAFPDWIKESCKVMMWMPGAAFDKERHRIGYGGGFYDRYLNRLLRQSEQTASSDLAWTQSGRFMLTTAALAYSCQILEQIPYEEHDIKPDLLVTEQGILLYTNPASIIY